MCISTVFIRGMILLEIHSVAIMIRLLKERFGRAYDYPLAH